MRLEIRVIVNDQDKSGCAESVVRIPRHVDSYSYPNSVLCKTIRVELFERAVEAAFEEIREKIRKE